MITTLTDRDVDSLDDLAQALARRGYLTMIVTGGGRPRLEVLDRVAPEHSGAVVCERDTAGNRWFWWTWADRIAPVSELAEAATLVDRDLRRAHGAA